MTLFIATEDSKLIAQILKTRRQEMGFKIKEVADDSFLRTKYIEAIENADLKQLPQGVYVISYIKKYAEYLGVVQEVNAALAKSKIQIKQSHLDKSDTYIKPNYSKFAIALLLFCFLLLSIWHFGDKQNSLGKMIRSYNEHNTNTDSNIDILVPIEEIESWVDGLSNNEPTMHFTE